MINLHFESAADNFLEKIRRSQPKHYRQIQRKLNILRQFVNPPGNAKVRGGRDEWRIPAGEYRIIYRDRDDGVRVITRIGKRNDGEIYDDTSRSR